MKIIFFSIFTKLQTEPCYNLFSRQKHIFHNKKKSLLLEIEEVKKKVNFFLYRPHIQTIESVIQKSVLSNTRTKI